MNSGDVLGKGWGSNPGRLGKVCRKDEIIPPLIYSLLVPVLKQLSDYSDFCVVSPLKIFSHHGGRCKSESLQLSGHFLRGSRLLHLWL